MKRSLRTAILGCGGFAHRHAANLIRLPGDIELAAFCDHHDYNARAFSAKYAEGKAEIFPSLKKCSRKQILISS